MHSLKSTAIAVVLLAVSVGLYQVSSTEDTTSGTDLTSQLTRQPTLANPHPAPQFSSTNGGLLQQQVTAQGVHQPPQPYQPPYQTPHQQPGSGHSAPAMLASSQSSAVQHQNLHAHHATQMAPPQLNQPNQLNQPRQASPYTSQPISSGAPPLVQGSPVNAPVSRAPSFDDLRRKFEQASPNELGNRLSTHAGRLSSQSPGGHLPPNQQMASSLSRTQSSIVQAVDQTRDQGLINALESQFNTANEAAPTLSSANPSIANPSITAPSIHPPSQPISITAPSASTFDPGPAIEQPAPAHTPSSDADFSPNLSPSLAPALNETKVDSEFSATPIGSANDSINSLASGHRSALPDLNVQQANLAPDSLTQNSAITPAAPSMKLEAAWTEVDRLVADKKFRAALGLLTRYYRAPGMNAEQGKRLHDWLDALAGKVIYSAEHHFQENPYIIRSGETLNQIASRWNVPAQVVYNINRQQIGENATIVAGTELKVINGPFHAEVDLSGKTLTLFLKNLYAGRFPIRTGISGEARPGQFRVVAKSAQGHTWRDADGNDFPPESSENGYGPYWIGLTGSLCLHAIDDATPEGHAGCIGLREKDARDIFGILINGSELKIIK